MPDCLIIANRGAGSFSGSRLTAACDGLAAAGWQAEPVYCRDFGEMTAAAARSSSESPERLVVAAGGDGTINAVLNGLAGNSAVCAILPLGTANVLAIELGIGSPADAVHRITSGTARPFTAGLLSNTGRRSRFFLMAGLGYDGAVVRGVTQPLKDRWGKGAYLISACREFAGWESGELHVTADGLQFDCHSLVVCNVARYGGNFKLAPRASLFTPELEVLAITDPSRQGLLALAADVLFHRRNRSIIRLSAANLRIDGAKPLQADGDYWGESPVTIAAEPAYARIML